jgi:hypothetical protein
MTFAQSRSDVGAGTARQRYGTVSGLQRSAVPVILLVLGSYVVLKPYYLLPSGLPQVGDLLMLMALPFALLLPQQDKRTRGLQVRLALFCGYAAMVSLAWTFLLMDPGMAVSATYYAFNLCLMIVCLRMGALYPRTTLLVIAYAISLSAAMQAAAIVLSFNAERFRQIASFNNPNQLGYWSLLSLCILWCIAGKVKIKWYIQAPTVVFLLYTTGVALSKSGMISAAFLCLLHFVKKPRLLFLGLLALAPTYLVLENTTLVERINARLENIGEQSDDTLETRGYGRIVDYPQYLVLGAGEQGLYRYSSEFDTTHEMHSTLGTVLFSYGLVGLAIFTAAIWCLYRISSDGRFLYVLPAFLYGFTHQGLRFSFFWLLLSVIAISSSLDEEGSASRKSARRLTHSSMHAWTRRYPWRR